MNFFPALIKQQWRIIKAENGYETNLCGAIDEWTARETCAILNDRDRVDRYNRIVVLVPAT